MAAFSALSLSGCFFGYAYLTVAVTPVMKVADVDDPVFA
jgi:hypothetical protein